MALPRAAAQPGRRAQGPSTTPHPPELTLANHEEIADMKDLLFRKFATGLLFLAAVVVSMDANRRLGFLRDLRFRCNTQYPLELLQRLEERIRRLWHLRR